MLIVLTGQTAVGKTVVEKELAKRGFYRAISYSTRPKRSNEKNGEDYHFLSNKEFDEKFEKKELYEKTSYIVNGELWQYGLGPKSFKDDVINVVTVNPHGLKQLVESQELKKEILVIDMYAPLELRKKRYLKRETSPKKEENLKQRLKQDYKDFVENNGVRNSGAKKIIRIENYNKTIEETATEIKSAVLENTEK